MKTFIKNLSLLPVLITGLGSVLAGQAVEQTFTVLHSFSASQDGAQPRTAFVSSGSTLYGTASWGGGSGNGTVFGINTDGTSFTVLHSFSFLSEGGLGTTNSDGATYPGLVLWGNTLYGTSAYGGASGHGTLFKVNTDGTGYTVLHDFNDSYPNSIGPSDGLILSGNKLYGTEPVGGSSFIGMVFSVNTDGTGFTELHAFTTDDEGVNPYARLVLSSNALYGTCFQGGGWGNGTVFALQTNGTGFRTLHSFTAASADISPVSNGTNSDGAEPYAALVLSAHTLYGVAAKGGSFGNGTVFALNADGTGFAVLHSFTAWSEGMTNSDGAHPYGGLALFGNTLYGTTEQGGSWGSGTVFRVNTDGSGFSTLHAFAGQSPAVKSDGGGPMGGLILLGNTLYGTTEGGGSSRNGTIFSISIPLELGISSSGNNVVSSWPTNFVGYTLQSTTNMLSPVWTTNLPAPVVLNGQNTVTNPISGSQQFFRLSQ